MKKLMTLMAAAALTFGAVSMYAQPTPNKTKSTTTVTKSTKTARAKGTKAVTKSTTVTTRGRSAQKKKYPGFHEPNLLGAA